jgi:putative ABC transport system ATP-binding protein
MEEHPSSTFEGMDWVLRSSEISVKLDRSKTLSFAPMTLNQGEIVLLKGVSGSGKSTFIHALSGLIRIHQGRVEINHVGTIQAGHRVPKNWRRNGVSVLPQRAFFWNSLSLKENLELAAWCKRVSVDVAPIVDLGLEDQSNQSAHSLSLGEQQRLGALRALLGSAPILLADEPTASLDDSNVEKLIQLLRAEMGEKTLLLSSHDSRLQSFVDRTIELHK